MVISCLLKDVKEIEAILTFRLLQLEHEPASKILI